MFEDIRNQMDVYECLFEINVNGSIHKQSMQAPRLIIEKQFIDLMSSASQDNRPVHIKLSRPVAIWDSFERKMIQREHSIEVKNRAYLEMEKTWK